MKKSGMSVGSGRASIRAGSALSGQCATTHTYIHVYTYGAISEGLNRTSESSIRKHISRIQGDELAVLLPSDHGGRNIDVHRSWAISEI